MADTSKGFMRPFLFWMPPALIERVDQECARQPLSMSGNIRSRADAVREAVTQWLEQKQAEAAAGADDDRRQVKFAFHT